MCSCLFRRHLLSFGTFCPQWGQNTPSFGPFRSSGPAVKGFSSFVPHAGQYIATAGTSFPHSRQNRLAIKPPLSRLYHDVYPGKGARAQRARIQIPVTPAMHPKRPWSSRRDSCRRIWIFGLANLIIFFATIMIFISKLRGARFYPNPLGVDAQKDGLWTSKGIQSQRAAPRSRAIG